MKTARPPCPSERAAASAVDAREGYHFCHGAFFATVAAAEAAFAGAGALFNGL